MRSFRFGVQAATATSGSAWASLARKAEDLGFSTLFVPDHFGEQLAPVAALMSAADATTTLRVGSLVFDNDFRHPLLLAKEAATIDLLSGGRFEFGLGAGWKTADYEESGIPHDEPVVRVARLEEAVRIVKAAFGADPVNHHGRHYTVTNHDARPKPLQSPVPIIIGGGGRRILTFAGQAAHIVGIAANLRAGVFEPDAGREFCPERLEQKIGWVREGAGARFPDIELQTIIGIVAVTDDPQAVWEQVGGGMGLTAGDAAKAIVLLAGRIEDMIETLQDRRERFGISYIVFRDDVMDAVAPIVAALAGR